MQQIVCCVQFHHVLDAFLAPLGMHPAALQILRLDPVHHTEIAAADDGELLERLRCGIVLVTQALRPAFRRR